jgi:hypothetical protein
VREVHRQLAASTHVTPQCSWSVTSICTHGEQVIIDQAMHCHRHRQQQFDERTECTHYLVELSLMYVGLTSRSSSATGSRTPMYQKIEEEVLST